MRSFGRINRAGGKNKEERLKNKAKGYLRLAKCLEEKVCKTIIAVKAKSTEEFGRITKIVIYQGLVGEKSEAVILLKNLNEVEFEYELSLNIEEKNKNGYYRCEVETELNKTALSNPIWTK